jgi:hypothetical protein
MEATTKRLLKDDLLVAMFRAVLERTPGAGPDPAQPHPVRQRAPGTALQKAAALLWSSSASVQHFCIQGPHWF